MTLHTKTAHAGTLFFLITLLLLLSGCAGTTDNRKTPSSLIPPPENYNVSMSENVFTEFQRGETIESDLIFVDEEKDIALRETDIVINQNDESSFWVMVTFNDLIVDENYTLSYQLYTDTNELFRSESFTFTSETPEYTTILREKLNPEDRKKVSAGEWTVKITVNDVLLATKTVSILSATPGQDVVIKEYKWKNFEFQYPGYCTIEEDRDIVSDDGKQFRLVKLTVSGKNRIGLFLYFADNWKPLETDGAPTQSPAITNMILGLPIALKHAEPVGAQAINLSVGSIELADGFSLATRFVIVKPDADTFSSLECFHNAVEDKMFFGILFTQGFKGKGSDTPEYFRFIQDTYSIIRSISMAEVTPSEEQLSQ